MWIRLLSADWRSLRTATLWFLRNTIHGIRRTITVNVDHFRACYKKTPMQCCREHDRSSSHNRQPQEVGEDRARSIRTLTQHDLTLERKSMNTGRLKGKWMQFKGELKQQWGKFFDNDLQQLEGRYDKIIGMLKERYGGNCVSLVRKRYGENKDELMEWADPWQQRSQPVATKERMRRGEVIKRIGIAG